jgi:hypothetical protein
MTAGQPPFQANSAVAMLKRVAEDTPRPIREIVPDTPTWLCDIIAKLHAKDPAERFQSAREVADLLADCEARLQGKQEIKGVVPGGRTPAPAGWKRWAAAAVLLPVVALGFTELAGITHVFRSKQVATVDSNEPSDQPEPIPSAKRDPKDAVDWVPLFNRTDLAGWKTLADQPGNWKVENGILVGSGPLSHLFSARGDYRDFHVRLEAKVNDIGDSGLYFRSDYGAPKASAVTGFKYPSGYEAQILGPGITNDHPTGSVVGAASVKTAPPSAIPADTWFSLEVIARGNHLTVRVNNRVTVDFLDERNTHRQGHFAIQCAGGTRPTRIQIRKIEIRELPAS